MTANGEDELVVDDFMAPLLEMRDAMERERARDAGSILPAVETPREKPAS